MERSRGQELQGNFNPLIIGELFWQQISKWEKFAYAHAEIVANTCTAFFKNLIDTAFPADMQARIWGSFIEDALGKRYKMPWMSSLNSSAT
jgi:hypothetical protein